LEFALALKKALTAHGVGPGPGVPEWNSLWRSRRRSRLTGWSLGQVCQNSVAQTASVTQGRDGSQTWRRPKQMPVDEKSLPGVRLQPGEVGLSEQRVCFGWRPGAPEDASMCFWVGGSSIVKIAPIWRGILSTRQPSEQHAKTQTAPLSRSPLAFLGLLADTRDGYRTD